LRAIVRRIAIDIEKLSQAGDEVVDGGREVGPAVTAAPLIEKQAVAFVFLERCGVKDAEYAIAYAYRLDLVGALAGSPPIEGVDVLQHRKHSRIGHFPAHCAWQVAGSEVRLPEQHEDHRTGMALAYLDKWTAVRPAS